MSEKKLGLSGLGKAIHIQRSVFFALFLRELKTRFGKFRLGYLWAFLEPAAHVAVIVTLMGIRKMRTHYPGMDTPVFLLTGIVPFFMFRHIVTQLSGAIDANQGLFIYKQVKPMDTMLTRLILEGLIYLVVYLVLITIARILGFNTSVADPLGVIMIYFALFCFSFGMGVFFGVISVMNEETKKVLPLILQPLYFMSAVLFPMRIVPVQYQPWLTWNPLMHFMELSRSSYFATYKTTTGNLLYLTIWTIAIVFIGLLLYWVKRRELVAS